LSHVINHVQCTTKVEQAELTSKAWDSIPNSAAIIHASAGKEYCGEQLPEITSPMSLGNNLACSKALLASKAPVWTFENSI
jgi:hypothetical protein